MDELLQLEDLEIPDFPSDDLPLSFGLDDKAFEQLFEGGDVQAMIQQTLDPQRLENGDDSGDPKKQEQSKSKVRNRKGRPRLDEDEDTARNVRHTPFFSASISRLNYHREEEHSSAPPKEATKHAEKRQSSISQQE